MRTFLSAVLVFTFSLVGAVALSAHVLAETALNPERAGKVSTWAADLINDELIEGLDADALASDALDNLLVDGELRDRVESQAGASPELTSALAELVESGRAVDYQQGQEALAAALEDAGKPGLAQKVRASEPNRSADGAGAGPDGDPASFLPDVGDAVTTKVAAAHDAVSDFARAAALIAVLAAAGGIIAANDRRSVGRGVANTLVFSLLFTVVTFLALPWLVHATTESGWLHRFAEGATLAGQDLALPLLPLFLAGLALRFVAPMLPQAARVPTHHGAVRGWLTKPGAKHPGHRANDASAPGVSGFGGRDGGYRRPGDPNRRGGAVEPGVEGTMTPGDGTAEHVAPPRY